ncbi:PIG-L deacetylase family protein [Henriciella barbarensis]|uniref:PIG-L deacetylase family protein n=1 Tax=Henriciella barbarensis TaxID=86342 RepID=UPI0015F79E81|nr:PIG-L family deacetylase [Henriciella barbarensis]
MPTFEGKRVLVVSPHPDDETIAAFGVIHRAAREAADVHVIVVTDGAASHDSARWPPQRLAAQRECETLAAMRRAGLGRNDVTFLRHADSGLARLNETGKRQLLKGLRRQPMPDYVFRPSHHDYHADHKVVARACETAWPAGVRQFAYLVWPEKGGDFRPRHALTLGPVKTMKLAAIRDYRSQTGMIEDDPDGFSMDRRMISSFCPPTEVFAEQ